MVCCVYRGQLRWERLLRTLANALMMLHDLGWGGCARGWSGWWGLARGAEVRRCVQAMRSTQPGHAADIAGPRWYAARIGGQLRWERVLANAGCALMMLRAVGLGAVVHGAAAGGGGLRGAGRGAAVHAGNRIRAGWAASLAPRLLRMTQLTSLNLRGTLRASAGSWAGSGCLRTPAMR